MIPSSSNRVGHTPPQTNDMPLIGMSFWLGSHGARTCVINTISFDVEQVGGHGLRKYRKQTTVVRMYGSRRCPVEKCYVPTSTTQKGLEDRCVRIVSAYNGWTMVSACNI